MATRQDTINYLSDQLSQAGHITSKKMFGEYALYCDEKVVAFVCDDQLYVKPTAISDQFLDTSHHGKPYPGAKDYFQVPEELWDDSDWLSEFIRETAAQLPYPKPKIAKRKKK